MEFNEKSEKSTAVVSMAYLPDVTLLEIFKNLNFIDLCKCSGVCRRWYRLTHSLSLRKKITVSKCLLAYEFSNLVKKHFHEHLESFEYQNDNFTPMVHVEKKTFFKLQEKCPKLKRLTLMGCSLTNVTLEDMPASLRYLSVRVSEMNPYRFFSACPQKYVPHLTCLDVGGVSNFLTSEDLYIFTHLKTLRCLYLEGCFRINNGGIESIKDVLNHLEVLDVEGTDISDEGVRTIITHGTMLKELFLGYVHLTDGAFHNCSINRLLKLKTICVRRTYASVVTIRKFYESSVMTVKVISDIDQFGNPIEHSEKNVNAVYGGCNHNFFHSCSY